MREALGLAKRSPDEFAVVRRQPLIVPPDVGLRPPQPGLEGPQAGRAGEQVRATLTGTPGADAAPEPVPAPVPQAAPDAPSQGESALLSRTGSERADPEIRQKVAVESASSGETNPTLLGRLLDWRQPASTDATLDAAAEAERLRGQRAQPPADAPSVVRREQTPLDLEE